jgi:hypothetical protein
MAEQLTPYIDHQAGDLITADNSRNMQIMIKEDIAKQTQAAKDDVLHGATPVDHAVNADEFDQKTPQNWIDELDQRFAPRVHDHEDHANYQRYLLEVETIIAGGELQPVVLIHEMGRHPLVEVYDLQDLEITDADGNPPTNGPFKLAFAGPEHAADPEASKFITKSWDERHWGDPIDIVKDSLAGNMNEADQKTFMSQLQENFTLTAWLTNLERQFFEPGPAQFHFDVGSIYRTQWVRERLNKKVSQLKDDGEWPPRLVYRPLLLNTSGWPSFNVPTDSTPLPIDILRVDTFHLNLNEIELQVHATRAAHLMVLLRA